MKLTENVTFLEPKLADYLAIARTNADGVDVCAITLPSGGWAIIREQNGEDDGIISNTSLQKDASSINLFIAAIIVYHPKATDKKGILTLDEVLAMPIRDKYVAMIKSRIFSMGHKLEFAFTWQDAPNVQDHYEENLFRYVWDYSEEFPFEPMEGKKPNKDYDEERVAPYRILPDVGGWVYFDMTGKVATSFSELSGKPEIKKLKFKLLDGFAERELLALGEEGTSINTKLLTRQLHVYIDAIWHKVESFKSFKSPEMAIMRKVVADYDQEFDGLTIIDNPRTKSIQQVPLMSIPSFFFPQGI